MNVGTLRASLRLDTSGFDRGLTRAERQSKKAGGRLKSALGTAGKLAGAALVAGVAAAVAALPGVINAAIQIEETDRTTKELYGRMTASQKKFVSDTAKLAGISDQAVQSQINSVASLRIGFGDTEKGAIKFAEKQNRLATELSLASQGLVSQEESIEAVNAAMRGEFDTIEKLNIGLRQEMINQELKKRGLDNLEGTQRKLAEQEIILQMIEKQSREDRRIALKDEDSLLRKKNELTNAIGNMKDAAVRNLIPALHGMFDLAKRGVKRFQEFREAIQKWIGRILESAGGVEGVAKDIREHLEFMVEEVKGFFRDLLPGKETMKSQATRAFSGIGEALGEVVEFFRSMMPQARRIFSKTLDAIKEIIRVFTNIGKDLWARFGEDFMDTIKAAWRNIKNIFRSAFGVIEGILDVFIGIFTGDWEKFKNGIISVGKNLWRLVSSVFRLGMDVLKGIFKAGRAALSAIFNFLKNAIVTAAKAAARNVANWFRSLFRWAKDIADRTRQAISDRFNRMRDAVVDFAKRMANGVIDWFKNLWDRAKTRANEIRDGIIARFRKMKDRVLDIVKNLRDGARERMDSIKNAMARPINWVIRNVINKLIGAWNKLNNLWGGKDIDKVGEIGLASSGGGSTNTGRNVFTGNRGGRVPGKGPNRDTVPALLAPGEFVIRRDAVRKVGVDYLSALNAGMEPHAYAKGGLVALGRWFQSQGARVSGHPAFPPIGRHTRGSRHYVGDAIDVNYGPAGESAVEKAFFDRVLRQGVLQRFGKFSEVLWRVAGHFNHLHVGGEGQGGGFMGWLGNAFGNIKEWAKSQVNRVLKKFPIVKNVRDWMSGHGLIGGAALGLAKKGLRNIKSTAVDKVKNFFGFGGGGITSGPVVDIVRAVARGFGWGDGKQWNSLYRLVQKESSWNPRAQNPTSSAYGLFQFLNSTWASTGIGKTSDPRRQAIAGMRYIRSRYGTPAAALAFHNRNNWYDNGGILRPGLNMAYNGTGENEYVLTRDQLLRASGGGGTNIYIDNRRDADAIRLSREIAWRQRTRGV